MLRQPVTGTGSLGDVACSVSVLEDSCSVQCWLHGGVTPSDNFGLLNSNESCSRAAPKNAQMKVPHNRSFANIKIINKIFDILLATDSDLSLKVK